MHEFTAQMTLAGVIVHFLQWAKKSQLIPFLTDNTGTLTRIISIVGAFAVSAGFSYGLEGNLQNGGALIIHFPGMEAFLDFLGHAGAQFFMSEIYYQGAVKQ